MLELSRENKKLYKLSSRFPVNAEDMLCYSIREMERNWKKFWHALQASDLFAWQSSPENVYSLPVSIGFGLDYSDIIPSVLAAVEWSQTRWHITLVSLREDMFEFLSSPLPSDWILQPLIECEWHILLIIQYFKSRKIWLKISCWIKQLSEIQNKRLLIGD